MRIFYICGKGGTGKTAITAALSKLFTSRGGVLCIAIDQPDQLASYFGCNKLQSEPHKIEDKLFAVHLDRQKCLDDFIKSYTKISFITNWILDHPAYPYVSAVAPGLREFLILDSIRIFSEKYPSKPWRTIIVDTPAAGHSAHLLQIPGPFAAALKLGPLRSRIHKTEKLLRSSQTVKYVLTATPDELPLNEAIEFSYFIKTQLKQDPWAIILNKSEIQSLCICEEELEILSSREEPLASILIKHIGNTAYDEMLSAIRFGNSRAAISNQYAKKITQSFSCPLFTIPYFSIADSIKLASQIMNLLKTEGFHE
jgi:anion-transporting  ArsA/GET3 family ATPase